MSPGSRVGVDVGGTFTDLVALLPSGRLVACKVPTTPRDPTEGVLHGLGALAPVAGAPATVAHGTTIVTNAVVERRTAPVALVTTRGFRDVLEIARQNRLHLYDLHAPARPELLVPRRLRFEVTERVGPDGATLVPLDPGAAGPIAAALRQAGIESVAVCLLHAYANPEHERALGAALRAGVAHVSLSSEVNAEFREYERTTTTVLNAAVMPVAARYVGALEAALGAGGDAPRLHLLHSAGGMMSPRAARARPLALAMSGPAAGVAAAAHVASRLALPRALAFDMGGTTTDVCLVVEGQAETAAQRRLGGHPVRLPMVAVESIGAGGGSIAFVDRAGALKVGPRSAGAHPGPACYGLGGTEPTVSDANLLLGYLDASRPYGGTIRLDRERAAAALEPVARRLGLTLLEAAQGVVEVANASMLRAVRLVSVQRGHDLRDFALIAYGGAGPLHAGALARQAGIRRVVVPAQSGAFSALGCLVSPLRYDAVQTHRARLEDRDARRVAAIFDDLERQCLTPLLEEGVPRAAITVERGADLRYVGQNYELEVPWHEEPGALRTAFEAGHRRLYGYATGEAVECVNLRVVAHAGTWAAALPAVEPEGPAGPVGEQRAWFPESGEVALPLYRRQGLAPGVTVEGPALVGDDWSTTIVGPGQRCLADPHGHLLLEVTA